MTAKIEAALDRLIAAVEVLEARGSGAQAARLAALEAERDRLAGEVRRLEALRAEDARLRAEAAEAVRAALGDLKRNVGAEGAGHA